MNENRLFPTLLLRKTNISVLIFLFLQATFKILQKLSCQVTCRPHTPVFRVQVLKGRCWCKISITFLLVRK